MPGVPLQGQEREGHPLAPRRHYFPWKISIRNTVGLGTHPENAGCGVSVQALWTEAVFSLCRLFFPIRSSKGLWGSASERQGSVSTQIPALFGLVQVASPTCASVSCAMGILVAPNGRLVVRMK